MQTQMRGEGAVVVGAGMAGLLAAWTLLERFERVTIVERDGVPTSPHVLYEARRGVPQGLHAHALLTRGQLAMEELLPGLRDELLTDGAPEGDALADFRLAFGGHRLPRAHAGLRVISVSRPHLEGVVRRRVLKDPEITVRAHCDAVGLLLDGGVVHGLRIVDRTPGSAAEVLAADLVVDASGRGSRLPSWLADLGRPLPAPQQVSVDLSYVSCRLRLDPDALDGDIAIVCGPSSTTPRAASLARLEDGEFLLTVGGFGEDRPPADLVGLTAFTAPLVYGRDLADALRRAEPVSEPVRYRYLTGTRRHARPGGLPSGLVAVGDAACSQDPIYGQGMTVAALQAKVLRAELARTPSTTRIQRRLSAVSRPCWEAARTADLELPTATSRGTLPQRVTGAYVERVLAAAAHDPVVATRFLRSTGLVDRPTSLLRPRVLLPALDPRRREPTTRGRPTRRRGRADSTTKYALAALMVPGSVCLTLAAGIAITRRRIRARFRNP